MSSREACAEYFRGQPGFSRIFEAMRKKWQSYGRTAGRVTLSKATEEERKALEGFLGRKQTGEELRFSLGEFEKALGETRFFDVTLEELLGAYFGEALVSNREMRLQKEKREQRFWEENREFFAQTGNEEALRWTEDMRHQREFGYNLLTAEYRKSAKRAQEYLRQTASCLRLCRKNSENTVTGKSERKLGRDTEKGKSERSLGGDTETRESGRNLSGREESLRLAVLAAEVTGNPHALDRQTTAGALFTAALCWREKCPFPQSAEKWKQLYEKNGILVDDLSSQVIAYGIHLRTRRGLHPAYEGFIQEKEPYVITLTNLEKICEAYGENRKIFVIENEMVFSALLEKIRAYPAALLCTSGQLRTAAYVLLDLLAAGDAEIFYAGDMDPEGLGIAQRIWERHPKKVKVWRMGPSDYEKALSRESISARRLEKLKTITHPVLRRTADEILKKKAPGYQERLIGAMAEDIEIFVAEGKTESLLRENR